MLESDGFNRKPSLAMLGFLLKMLVDCGASMSLLHRGVFDSIPLENRPVLKASPMQVKFADGRLQENMSTTVLALKIGKDVQNVEFLVGNFTDDAILGLKDLKGLGLVVDFKTSILTKDNYWIPTVDVECRCKLLM